MLIIWYVSTIIIRSLSGWIVSFNRLGWTSFGNEQKSICLFFRWIFINNCQGLFALNLAISKYLTKLGHYVAFLTYLSHCWNRFVWFSKWICVVKETSARWRVIIMRSLQPRRVINPICLHKDLANWTPWDSMESVLLLFCTKSLLELYWIWFAKICGQKK